MPDTTKFLFAVLSTYERHGWLHPSILQFFCDLAFKQGIAYRVVPVHNFMPAASGRNLFCQQSKDSEADWLVMIDNDMALPDNLLDTVKDAPADADIIVPTFYMWSQSDLKLTLCWGMGHSPSGLVEKMEPGFHELTKCGTGAIFIRPKVFKALEYPYFKYLYDGNGSQSGTEDIQFCLAARAKGMKIYGNPHVKVGHYHSVELASLWDWYEKTLAINKERDVDSAEKDSGRSPEQTAVARSAKA